MTELSARVHAAAVLMTGDAGRRPELADFLHLDLDAAPTPVPAQEPTAPAPPPVLWNTAAFDALPADVRSAVMAGTASIIGRAALELEAEQEMVRPGDVHLHLVDPARYVDQDGLVDRERMRADLAVLVRDRPELSRFGHRPDQERQRPDTRRRSPGGTPVGAVQGPSGDLRARVEAASAVMQAGRR